MMGALLLAGTGCQADAQTTYDFQHEALDEWLDQLHEQDRFMGSVAIRHQGELVYEHQVGWADVDSRVAHQPDTRFRIGSVSKPMTSVMILQLAAEGLLSLDDTLDEYFEAMPNAGRITIEQMLRHRSGLFSFTSAGDYREWMTEYQSRQDLLDRFAGYDPEFEPGEESRYSNTNYVLLGFIIEEVAAMPYAVALADRIARPLDLQNTFHGDSIDVERGDAHSYTFSDSLGHWQRAPETDMSVAHAAGGVVSIPAEVTRFYHGLFEGELLDDEGLERMTDLQARYGLGIMPRSYELEHVDGLDELEGYGHGGSIDGFRTESAYFPEQELSVAITANALRYSRSEIMEGILSAFLGKAGNVEKVSVGHYNFRNYGGEWCAGLPFSAVTGQAELCRRESGAES